MWAIKEELMTTHRGPEGLLIADLLPLLSDWRTRADESSDPRYAAAFLICIRDLTDELVLRGVSICHRCQAHVVDGADPDHCIKCLLEQSLKKK